MKIVPLAIAGVFRLRVEELRDERGMFARLWDGDALAAVGAPAAFVQQSVAWNELAGTVRGLHLARSPAAETKIVRCTRGSVVDIILDARADSATYGRHVSVRLDAAERGGLVVPPGCAHGYQTLVDGSELLYDISEAYRAELAAGIAYDDPALGIEWPLPVSRISDRDAAHPSLHAYTALYPLEVPS